MRDRAELTAFLDGVMTANLRDKHVAGATVAVVKEGALFYAKGYGYADVARRAPVDAERTLFRIGSTSKLFTWTGVMQLVEQGKLDLDADVNRYLDFRIPATYPQPITLRHVMTHTPGFEEDGRDLITEDSTRTIPLGRWLAGHIPGTRASAGVTVSLLELVFLVAVGTIVGGSGGLLEGPLTSLKLALALPVVATLLALGAVYFAVHQWRLRAGTRGARLRYCGAVAVALLFTWSLAQWNLLGWRLQGRLVRRPPL